MDNFYQKLVNIEYVLCVEEKTKEKKTDTQAPAEAEQLQEEKQGKSLMEVLYLILIYEKAVRVKVITI